VSEKSKIGSRLRPEFEDIFPLLLKQKRVIFVFMAAVLVSVLIGGLLKQPEYRASATLQVRPKSGQELQHREVMDFTVRGYFEIQQFYRTELQIITSRRIREEVLRAYNEMGFTDLLEEDNGLAKLSAIVTVVPEEQSQLLRITTVHTDPERAAIIANLFATTYAERSLEVRQEMSSSATTWLRQQLDEYQAKYDQVNEELLQFKRDNNLADVEESLNTLNAQFEALNRAYGEKSTERLIYESEVSHHFDLSKRNDYDRLSRLLTSPTLTALNTELSELLAKEAEYASRYGAKHPSTAQIQGELESLRRAVNSEVDRVLRTERAQLDALSESQERLSGEIDTVKQAMLIFQEKKVDFDKLAAKRDETERLHKSLSSRLEEVALASRTQSNNVSFVDHAVAPESPFKPNIPLNMIVGLFVGLLGGVALAFLREYVDDTVSSKIDVSTYLKLPFLGVVPVIPEDIPANEYDLYTYYHPRSSVAEAVRGVRAMVELNPTRPSPTRLLVTSSLAREGKTSMVARLGIAYAQMGKRVVLIEGDLRRPRLHQVFSGDNTVGLANYLMDAATVDDILTPTVMPGLYAIYSGPSTAHPNEALGTERMEALLSELEKRVDVVILDSPPSVPLADAMVLSRFVDGVVLVVKDGSISRSVVEQMVEELRQVDANILGVVLNNVDIARNGSRYKYYHAYRDYYTSYADSSGSQQSAEEEVAK